VEALILTPPRPLFSALRGFPLYFTLHFYANLSFIGAMD
jgi:hypothetical protein